MDILEEEIKKADDKNGYINGVDSQKLISFIERIERLEEEKKELSTDIRDIFGEARSEGWSVKAIREVLKLRKLDSAERNEQDYLVNEYRKMAGI